ncbi:MAG TPA: TylF/MycF/NovP-related O-methyltransferase, partial [Thermoanaerobaculia bacterium]|nr:TylF/MycF/NovP-related O-methyltransferase [Thermoanaerobaculia bacterium]
SDYKWHWRVHIGLWAAFTASKLPGDFVECGVNRGFLSSAIMEFLNWDSLNKTFYLLDTFNGLDLRQVSAEDRHSGAIKKNASAIESSFYVRGVESVEANFAQWKNTRIVAGSIPGTLERVQSKCVAYLHLDMNCSQPEVAALRYFWDRLVPGAIVLLDDYAYYGYESQKHAMDDFAKTKDVMIASLPTGQGLLVRPPD